MITDRRADRGGKMQDIVEVVGYFVPVGSGKIDHDSSNADALDTSAILRIAKTRDPPNLIVAR